MIPMSVADVAPTILSSAAGYSRPGNAVTEHETYIPMAPIPYDLHQVTAPVNRQARSPGDPCHTLAKQNAHNAGIVQSIGFDAYNNDVTGDVSKTIDTGQDYHHVPIAFNIAPGKGELKDDIHVTDGSTTKTLDASGSNPAMHQGGSAIVQTMAVRRLTPVECERLQGFPDNYTNIRENCPDGPRYKAMGNSMAVPVMRWIGERIALCS